MKNEELVVEMFGQEDTVVFELYDKTNKELVHKIIKENIIHKAKSQNYSPISEPVIEIYGYLKMSGESVIPVPDEAEADLIVFHTMVKVVKEQLK